MTETEHAVNKVFNPYRSCIDCGRLAHGGDYCSVCRDLKDGQPYSLAQLLTGDRFNSWAEIAKVALGAFALLAAFFLFAWIVCI